MRKFNLNWGVSLALIVLLAYTYIASMGVLYGKDGTYWKAALFAFGVIIAVSACVFFMVNAKVSKSKELSTIFQAIFGAVILVIFIFSGIPFTSFLEVAGNRHDTKEKIDNVRNQAMSLDSAYLAYADQRVANYKQTLSAGSALKAQSLQRRLCPEGISEVQQQRREWVDTIGGMSIWNIHFPENLNKLQSCVEDWTINYRDISSTIYSDEPQNAQPFEYTDFDNSLKDLKTKFENPGFSINTIWVILIAILATLAMMVPYWLATPLHTRKPGPIVWREQIKRDKENTNI